MAFGPIELRGSPEAKVVLTVFSDYQCPYCKRFARETEPLIEARYVDTGKIRIGFRHLPLEQIHPFARGAAIAAECANRQGRFWEMHRLLFDTPDKLSPEAITAKAMQTGLEVVAFEACQSKGDASARIASDVASAQLLKLTGTPALLVGRLVGDKIQYLSIFPGAASVEDLSAALDSALAGSYRSYLFATAVGLGFVGCSALLLVRRRRRKQLS